MKKLLLLLLALVALAGCVSDEALQPDQGAEAMPGEAPPEATGRPLTGQSSEQLRAKRRVYFAFDSSAVDETNRAIVEAHAAYLVENPSIKVTLEGHADERGTREYNLALGERRGQSVERMLRLLGVAANRISVVSYGEEKPVAVQHNESAWRLNRRVEIQY